MKLLLIYGSPAVGKLTVANAVARLTGFKVFHNHLTIDAVKPVFDFGTEPFWRLVHQFRIQTIGEAARQNVDLIYTFCYAKDSDDAHVAEVVKAVEENGGEIIFVLLVAEKETIEKRVLAESRLEYRKINELKILHEIWEKYELFLPINHRESLIVDNTFLTAGETAARIIKYFGLREDEIKRNDS